MWLIGLMVALPLLAAVAVAWRHRGPAVDDFAIIEFQLRHLLGRNTALTGSYSRSGWNHPGPMMFWLIEPFWLALGRNGRAMYSATPVIAATFITAALVLAARAGRTLFAVVALTIVGSIVALPPWLLVQPWNPWLIIPALACFLALVLRVVLGRTRDLIGMVVVGSFITQAHVSGALLVGAGFIFALGSIAIDARVSNAPPDRWRSTLVWCGAVAIVIWSLPLHAVTRHEPGNLVALSRYFRSGHHAVVGIGAASAIAAHQFRWLPPWMGAGYHVERLTGSALTASRWWLVVPGALLVAGAGVAFAGPRDVGGRRAALRVVVFAAWWFVIGIIAISRADEPRAYAFAWCALTSVLAVTAPTVVIAQRLADRARLVSPSVAMAVVAVVCTAGSVTAAHSILTAREFPLEGLTPEMRAFEAAVGPDPVPAGQRVRVETVGTFLPSLGRGVVDLLDARGAHVGVPAGDGRLFNRSVVLPRSQADMVWYVTEEGAVGAQLAELPRARVLWSTSPLGVARERGLADLQAATRTTLVAHGRGDLVARLDSPFVAIGRSAAEFAAGGVDAPTLQRLAALNALVYRSGSCRCAVVAVPGGRSAQTR